MGKFGPIKRDYLFKLKFVKLIGLYRIRWWWSLFLFSTRNSFLWLSCSTKSKYQLMLKLGTYTYLNMHHSIVVYIFLYFRLEISFLGKFGPKNLNCHFKLKFGTGTNSNMQNSLMMFTFSVFDWK